MNFKAQHNKSKNIVILEKDPIHRDFLKSIILKQGYVPLSFDKETICFDNLLPLNPILVILGSLSSRRIFRFINGVKIKNRFLPILIVLKNNVIQDYIDINNFQDVYVVKLPIRSSVIKKNIDRIRDNRSNKKVFQNNPLIIGNSPEMDRIKKMIPELSRSKVSVLIQGEEGTGKDLVARAIHFGSVRRNNPFIKINAADLSNNALENEGGTKSAISFAIDGNGIKGLFEAADTGTLFLDEIGCMSASHQAELLRILDDGGISNIDSKTKKPVDVRIVAANKTNLGMLVAKKGFRKDLFYRLNVINIEIPPLRNRTKDIPILAVFFNDRFCGELCRSHCDISKKIRNKLKSYFWPGNVRELKNVIKSWVLCGNEKVMIEKIALLKSKHESSKCIDYSADLLAFIDFPDVKKYLKDLNSLSLKNIRDEFIMRTETRLLKEALEKTNWNRKKAAVMLNVSYKSLLNKIKDYNLNIKS